MFLKVQYAPTASKYYYDFDSVKFTSYLDEVAPIVNVEESIDTPNSLLSEEYLDEEKGCGKHEDRKDCFYVNQIDISYKPAKDFTREDKTILFTGQAYLVNNEGKTVDILR